MFESLKKKLKGFFGKEEKPKKSTKKPKTNKAKQKPSKKKTPSEKKLKKIADNIQEEVPLKFEPGELKYEPDIEAIKEKDSETSPTEKKGFFSRFAEKFTPSSSSSGGSGSSGSSSSSSDNSDSEEEKAPNYCSTESREVEYCDVPSHIVCGWYSVEVTCPIGPCVRMFGNECEACRDQSIEYWTEGECPIHG
jgi:hypothetical protein